ncbi:MAG: SLC13/DASS family transporter [Sandaracinaceae bacterium]|nr:SLC13/DASS family transporter [Sandaracinaceae bacterium]
MSATPDDDEDERHGRVSSVMIASRRNAARVIGRLEVSSWRRIGIALACLALAAAITLVPPYPDLPDAARWALFITVLAAGLWITEAISAFAVGLLVIGLSVAILGRPGGVFAQDEETWKIFLEPWGSPLIWLFFGGFVLARGISRSRLDAWLSLAVLRRFGASPSRVLFGAMGVTFAFSMFASNTATSAMMIATLAPVVAAYRGQGFAKALLIGVAFAANLGGMATLIGTPPNAIAAGLLATRAPIGFAKFMVVGLPVGLISLMIAWRFLVWTLGSERAPIDLSALERPAREQSALPAWRRLVVIGTALVTVVLWMTEPLHGIMPPVVALVPVTALTVSGVLGSADIRGLEWDVLLLLAGGLTLGVAVSRTGLADYLVRTLPVEGASPLALAAVLALATAVLSNFMSNTATANIVAPIGLALAGASGAEAPVVVAIGLSASAAMALPISTPPNAIAFASGELTTRDFIPLGVLVGAVATALGVLWSALVLG